MFDSGSRAITLIMENQMEKNSKHEMQAFRKENEIIQGAS